MLHKYLQVTKVGSLRNQWSLYPSRGGVRTGHIKMTYHLLPLSVSKEHSAQFIKKCVTGSLACHVIV